jgi:hypothetical protein
MLRVLRAVATLSEFCRSAFPRSETRSPLLKVSGYRPADMNPYRAANDSRIGLAVPSVIPPMLWWQRPSCQTREVAGWALAWVARPLARVVSSLSQGLHDGGNPREGACQRAATADDKAGPRWLLLARAWWAAMLCRRLVPIGPSAASQPPGKPSFL